MGILTSLSNLTSTSSDRYPMKMKVGPLIFTIFLCFSLSSTSTLRKKRQLVDALNALTEEALKADAEKINQDAAPKDQQRQVHRMSCSGAIDSQCRGQKCVVSCADGEAGFVDVSLENNDASKVLVRCGTQEEVGRVRRQNTNPSNFGFGQVQNCEGGRCGQQNAGGFGNVQRCRGAGCQQANTGGFGHVQDCAGGRCGQLNANDFPGRRKRQIVDALNAAVNALTEEALSAEKSAALNEEALSAEESTNDGKLEGRRLEEQVQKVEEQVHTFECGSNVSSRCRGAECEVTCADGKGGKFTLECEDGLVEVASDSSEGAGTVQVRCGSTEKADKKVEAVRSLFRSSLVV